MKRKIKKNGFTLMELLVYMAIVGIVVVIAGQVFSDSTKMRVRTQSMIEASAIAENVGSLFREDVAQMGAKSAVNSVGADDFVLKNEVFMPVPAGSSDIDYSSFDYYKNNAGVGRDSLAFRRIKYDDNGVFKRVEEISWFASAEGVLYRQCKTITPESAADDECAVEPDLVEISDNVESFIVTPATPGVVESDYSGVPGKQYPRLLPSNVDRSITSFRLIPRFGETGYVFALATPAGGASSISLSGFASNYDFEQESIKTSDYDVNQFYVAPATNADGSWKDLCTQIDSLQEGVEYEISFKIPSVGPTNDGKMTNKMMAFCPGRDHMSVGFRKKSDGSAIVGLDDFLFYPPVTTDASVERRFRFSPKSTVKEVCMAFTFAIFSPVANTGSISIQDLELNRVSSSNYTFVDGYTPANIADKQNIKAFRLQLKIKKNKETGNVALVVPTPSNGKKD